MTSRLMQWAIALALLGASASTAWAQSTVTYAYDQYGRLITTSYSSGPAAGYTYDAADNRTRLTISTTGGPVAVTDSLTVSGGAPGTVSVLANDASPQGYSLSVSSASNGSHGTTAVNSGTTITYTPASGYSGSDSFTYTLSDGHSGTSTGTVNVTVSSAFTTTIHIASSTSSVNLRSLANTAGYNGAQPANITFVVDSGVTVTGSAGALDSGYGGGAGGVAIDTGTWPTGYSLTLALTVSSSATVRGGGGGGGNGGNGDGSGPSDSPAHAGGAGGDAINCQAPITVTVNSGGAVKGGGGGGGGGDGTDYNTMGPYDPGTDFEPLSAGGGGGGFPNGAGANSGTSSGGGAGGVGDTAIDGNGNPQQAGTGGAGGGAGAAGAAGLTSMTVPGGAAGYAIRKNGNTVTVTNSGTVTGTVS